MRDLAPVQFDQPRRAMAGAAHGVDRGKILLQQGIAGDGIDRAAVGLADAMHHGFELLRPHVLRRRVDQVAHQAAGLELGIGVGEFGRIRVQRETRGRARRFAVAVELVGTQAPAEQHGGRVETHAAAVGEMVDAFGQRHRQMPEGERIGDVADARQHQRRPPVRIRHQQHAAGRGGESERLHPCARRCRRRGEEVDKIAAAHGHDRRGAGAGGGRGETVHRAHGFDRA